MDRLIPKQQAQVLTPKGFFRHFKQLVDQEGLTRKEAYYQTEALHMDTHEDGESKYSQFVSFNRQAKRFEKENS